MLQTANAKSVQIKFYTADRLPCFGCQMFKKWPLKLGRMYQTAHQNDGFNALRLNCINSTLPACAMIPNQQNFTRHDERFNFSTIFSGCQIGQVRVTFKSDQAQWFHLEVLSLQSRKSFEYFFCFHRTLGISPKDLEGFKADIAFIYTALACSLAILPQILTFVTRNFIGSCLIRGVKFPGYARGRGGGDVQASKIS